MLTYLFFSAHTSRENTTNIVSPCSKMSRLHFVLVRREDTEQDWRAFCNQDYLTKSIRTEDETTVTATIYRSVRRFP